MPLLSLNIVIVCLLYKRLTYHRNGMVQIYLCPYLTQYTNPFHQNDLLWNFKISSFVFHVSQNMVKKMVLNLIYRRKIIGNPRPTQPFKCNRSTKNRSKHGKPWIFLASQEGRRSKSSYIKQVISYINQAINFFLFSWV